MEGWAKVGMSLVKDEDKNQVTFQFPFANKAMKFGTRKSATDRVVGTGTWLFYMPSVSSPKIQLACSRDIYDGGWMLILVPVHRHTLLLKVHAYNKLLKSPFVIERSSGTRDIIGIPLFFLLLILKGLVVVCMLLLGWWCVWWWCWQQCHKDHPEEELISLLRCRMRISQWGNNLSLLFFPCSPLSLPGWKLKRPASLSSRCTRTQTTRMKTLRHQWNCLLKQG